MYTKDWSELWVGFMCNLAQTKCLVAGFLLTDQTSHMGPPSHRFTTRGFKRWFGWWSWAPLSQSPDSSSGHGDLECHLTGGAGGRPGVGLLIAPQLGHHVLESSLVRTLPPLIGWGAQSRATSPPHWEERSQLRFPAHLYGMSPGRLPRKVFRACLATWKEPVAWQQYYFPEYNLFCAMQWWKWLVILVGFSLWSLFPFCSSGVRLHTIYC